jgi:RNA polymerase sigma-70 factor, ECF subfamily
MKEGARSDPGSRADGNRPSGHGVVCALEGRRVEPLADAELVALVRRGDRQSAALLYDRYAPLVRRLLARMTGPGEEVRDLTQEVFIAVVQGLGSMRDPSALRSFVYGVTLNVARMALRRRKRRWLVLFGHESGADPVTLPEPDEPRRAVERLYQLLDGLDEPMRTTFVLRYVEQVPLGDIAELLGWSLATTKRRLERASTLLWARARAVPELHPYLPCARQEQRHG